MTARSALLVGAAGSKRRTGPTLPAFVVGSRVRTLAGTTVVGGALTGTIPGDIILAFPSGSTQTSSLTPPSGVDWGILGDTDPILSSDPARMRAYAVVATLNNQAGGTWTFTTTAGDHWIEFVVYRHAVLPTVASMNKVANARSIVAPSVTTLHDKAVVVYSGFFSNAGSAISWSGTGTSRVAAASTATDGQIIEEARPTAGATGTRTFTTSTTGSTATATSTASVILEAA